MKIYFDSVSNLMQDAITEIVCEYHNHRLETQEWYKEIDDLLGDGVSMDRDFKLMNMTQYMYEKYNMVVTELKGYRVEISYLENGTERARKTKPEIQGLTITEAGLTDEEVKLKVLQIALRISEERNDSETKP
jgi:hypothetical protein